ncbi:putative retrograde regulation protein 2 [Hyaloscypha hepaticicola]|uniref:Putative retrograde regulation protein 2 n=1 Tax=Hyaloscypha hepaticicola TaxID=2082293 RepID=A0A2J6PGX2_9HELO|nr:putative retrograde regulation protein 2 [Hyaloscypha hepaticicola]
MADEMGSVITIDNFTTKMSSFDPNRTQNHLYGLVDMGSNGIRFSISDLSPPRSRLLHCVYRERAGISLYDALHESTPDSQPFHFSKNTITQVANTLRRFKGICDSYGVHKDHISVFATEAMRTAKNRDEMLEAIKSASGLTVDILSPGMESLFGAMGARSGFTQVNGLFMDLGGGSVQMTYVDSTVGSGYDVLAAEAAKSMPFGAAKLTAALSAQDTAQTAKIHLRSSMKETFEGLLARFPHLKELAENDEGITIYFCGGGFRGYGSMLMHTDPIQPYPIPAIGGYTVPGHRFIKWREMLHANNYEEAKIYGMSKRRREQFPAIVTVVQSLVEAIPRIKEVIFCSGGNREGVLFMKLPPEIRESNPLPLLPSGTPHQKDEVISSIVASIISALPKGYPATFSTELLTYVAKNIWQSMGDPDDANSAKALHTPISGDLAGLPGMTHQIRAILALTICARWGTVAAPADRKLYENLQSLIGPELSWWCDCIGTVAGFLPTLTPIIPSNEDALGKMVKFETWSGQGLGKKGHKVGIRLKIVLDEDLRRVVRAGELESMFGRVGKGLTLGWKVEAEVEN